MCKKAQHLLHAGKFWRKQVWINAGILKKAAGVFIRRDVKNPIVPEIRHATAIADNAHGPQSNENLSCSGPSISYPSGQIHQSSLCVPRDLQAAIFAPN
jgi:hypothetical protein